MSAVQLHIAEGRIGSGFTVSNGGALGIKYTVTNYHVCNPAIEVGYMKGSTTYGSEMKILKILKYDKMKDLCILAGMNEAQPLQLAQFEPHPGDKVGVFGFPADLPGTFTQGEYTGRHNVRIMDAETDFDECFSYGFLYNPFGGCLLEFDSYHITAQATGGSSGSAVINSEGRVIGVLFAVDRRFSAASFVRPLTDLRSFLIEFYNGK